MAPQAPKTVATPEEVAALKGAVLLKQPEPECPRPEELTFTDLTGLAFTKASAYADASEYGSAKREYALAKTAIEEAVMRFNRARSIDLGIFHVTDTEDPAFLQAVANAHEQAGGGDSQ